MHTGTSHTVFPSARRSNHAVGRAADIRLIDAAAVVDPATPDALLADVMRRAGELGATEVGGPVDLDGPGTGFFSDPAHQDHLHIGISEGRAPAGSTGSSQHSTPAAASGRPCGGRPCDGKVCSTPLHPLIAAPREPPRMSTHPRAGTPALPADLVDVGELLAAYHDRHPDPDDPGQRVAFGTSGHRGSSLRTTFNDDHIAATSQAICEYRAQQGTDGPLFIGRDTHALSEPAWVTAIEVFQANGVHVLADGDDAFTPTPAVSHAILTHNRARVSGLADGVVVTPSHNPPPDGGFKYNPPDGGPADNDATGWIAARANELLAAKLDGVRRTSLDRAGLGRYDFLGEYVSDLPSVLDLDAIRECRHPDRRRPARRRERRRTGRRSRSATASTSRSSTRPSTRSSGS